MKLDGRALSHATLEELRIRTVRRVEAGESPEVLAKALGLHRSTIYGWLSKRLSGGYAALKAKPVPGRPPKLNGRQVSWLVRALTDKTPEQFKFPWALWTRDMVREVIMQKFGISLSRTAVTKLLSRLGFTFQKPAMRFKQQDKVLVSKWTAEDFPAIKRRAKEEDADIYFADEAGVRQDYTLGKTIGVKGKTPIVERTGKRFRLNMISAVGLRGECRFMVIESTVNGEVFTEFLRRLIKNAPRKILLILDNHPIHKSKEVKAFVQDNKEKIELFFLPPYSPELNPDELVWNHVKNHGLSRHLAKDLEHLRELVFSKLHQLQKLPKKVQSFFQTPTTAYTLAG